MSDKRQPKTPIHSLPPDVQDLIRRLRKQAETYRRKYQDLKRQAAQQK